MVTRLQTYTSLHRSPTAAPPPAPAGTGPVLQQRPLRLVRGQPGRPRPLPSRLAEAAEPVEQVGPHAVRAGGSGPARRWRRAGPRRAARPRARTRRRCATARFSSTTGDDTVGAPARRRAPPAAPSRCPRGRTSGRGTTRSPPAACTGPPRVRRVRRRRSASARAKRRLAPVDVQRVPATGGPGRTATRARPTDAVRARNRDDWNSISATSPCTSASSGASAASTRPSRSASAHSSGRSQSSPAVAE